jgi:hypothetical protein
MSDLVLHINREVIHHGAAIAQLRDLYLWKAGGLTPGNAERVAG